MRLRTVLIVIAAVICVPPLLINVGFFVHESNLRSQGYHVGVTGWAFAQEIVDRHLPVTECSKINNSPEFMAPTSEEQQALCYYKVAEFLKDPTVCEYLMPSTYGLACLGGATISQPCVLLPDYKVLWTEDGAQQTFALKDCRTAKNLSQLGSQCCQIASVSFLRDEDDCSPLRGSPTLMDQCQSALARKIKEPSLCASIANENVRHSCEVQVKALKAHPEICEYCTPLLNSADAL